MLALMVVTPTMAQESPRAMGMPDILEWKSVRARAISTDGSWLAYYLAPTEGDSEVVVRSLTDDTEYRFATGELPMFGGGELEFAATNSWLAFEIRATREAAAKSKTPLPNSVGLVDLASGEMTKIERARSFAFGGADTAWLAVHKMAPEGRDDKDWAGSDLLLRRVEDAATLTLGNVAEYAFNDSGEWLATAVDTEGRVGNGLQIQEMASGRVLPLDSAEAAYRRLSWHEDGDALAVLRSVKNEDYEDELVAVVGIADIGTGAPRPVVYDPAGDDAFPAGMTVNANHSPAWTDSRDALMFRIHEVEMTEEAKAAAEKAAAEAEEDGAEVATIDDEVDTADLVIWHWRDRRLQSRQQVVQGADRNFGYLSAYRVAEERFVRLADDDVRNVTPAPGQRWAIGNDNQKYERDASLSGRSLSDVWIVDMATGERRLALEASRWVFGASPSGDHLLHYDDGNFYSLDLASGESVNLTADLGVPFWNVDDDHNVAKPPVFQFGVGWSDDGDHILLYDGWDIWKMGADGSDAVNLTQDGRERQVRYQRVFRLDPDLDGIDLSAPMYVTTYGEWTKKRGIARLEPTGGATDLVWGDAAFGSLMKAEDADVYVYTRETHADPPNYYVADAALGGGRQVTDTNPQQAELAWSAGVQLVDYTSDKGAKLQGALFLPANYEPGKQYPTMVYIYEKLSQGANTFYTPSANGFNKSVYTSAGYAVLMPDIVYEINDPGQSALWSVIPALDAAIATGVVDPEAVGLHGHSWGGYQTSHLITQTDRFSAAIAGAPLTNMISMYSLIYKNAGIGNGQIFEASQGRFTGGPWDVTDAYVRNSPVYHAENVTTPLIILHNDQDGAVDFTQGVEYYNTLRRLDKNVVMLQYVGENHGLRDPANRKDYTVRMREFFDHYLRDLGMPAWLQEGVDYLDLEDHLKERAQAIADEVAAAKKAAEAAAEAAATGESGDGDGDGEGTGSSAASPADSRRR
jgi:dipeptidyl aminopeptidase/acylaminoacyl peptidase